MYYGFSSFAFVDIFTQITLCSNTVYRHNKCILLIKHTKHNIERTDEKKSNGVNQSSRFFFFQIVWNNIVIELFSIEFKLRNDFLEIFYWKKIRTKTSKFWKCQNNLYFTWSLSFNQKIYSFLFKRMTDKWFLPVNSG